MELKNKISAAMRANAAAVGNFWYRQRYALAAALLGAAFFILLYGVRVLDPTNVAWILNRGGDPSQHYLGWEFYRQSEVHLPYLGMSYATVYPYRTSIIYTDSIPLLAVAFKAVSVLLPEPVSILESGDCSALWPRDFCPENRVAHQRCGDPRPLGALGDSIERAAVFAVSRSDHPYVCPYCFGRKLADPYGHLAVAVLPRFPAQSLCLVGPDGDPVRWYPSVLPAYAGHSGSGLCGLPPDAGQGTRRWRCCRSSPTAAVPWRNWLCWGHFRVISLTKPPLVGTLAPTRSICLYLVWRIVGK